MFSTSHRRCWAEIDLGALERNLKRIQAALPGYIRYVAVVKADAYGHGMAPTVSRMMHAGVDMFAVANVFEAGEIREIGSGWPVLVLSAILPEEDKYIDPFDVIPTVSTEDEVARFAAIGQARGRPLDVHLKIDTGMGRAGVWYSGAASLYARIREAPGLTLAGIFTHFSSAESDQAFTDRQRQLFLETLLQLPGLPEATPLIHADNSAGLETLEPDGPFSAVRIGLLQFGVRPYPGSLLDHARVEPVFSFHSRVGMVKTLPEGTGVSYGRTHCVNRETRVAILTAGYGDGIPTAASNRAEIIIRGRRCPVLGRVTMDQTIIDVTELPEVACGDIATIIGRQEGEEISLSEFSRSSASIPWEILCSITKRVNRVYQTSLAH